MKILLSPHNDDEVLFTSFTIIREKPLVVIVTDGSRHEKKRIATMKERREETERAMKRLGAKSYFLGIHDDELELEHLISVLSVLRFAPMQDIQKVYAPAVLANGNPDHNIVGKAAKIVFGDRVTYYSTYTIDNLTPRGNVIVMPTDKEIELKCKALCEYTSQIRYNRPHFDAVIGHPEYYIQ